MERLSIDEVIAHCKRHTERMESHSGRSQLEENPIGNSNIMKQYWEHRQVAEWLEQLKAYKDAEKQGLLVKLPCKVGDVVYLINHTICRTRKIPLKCVVDEFTFDKDNRCYAVLNGAMSFYAMRRFEAIDVNKFGLTIFLTKEEAEQALKQMK